MPYNHGNLEKRLKNCKKKLHALFGDQGKSQLTQQKIQEVDDYYNLSYTKATTAKTVEQIATRYELLVENLTQVKKGTLNSETALNQMSSAAYARKRNVVLHDLAKMCESMFWAATTLTLYAAVFGIALPVLVVQPVLGVAVAITIVGAMLKSAYNSLSCLGELKSFGRHSSEYDNEARLVSFFKPRREAYRETQTEIFDEELDQSLYCTN